MNVFVAQMDNICLHALIELLYNKKGNKLIVFCNSCYLHLQNVIKTNV